METTTKLSDLMPRPVTAGTDWSLQSAKIDQLIAAKSRADVALRNAPKSKAVLSTPVDQGREEHPGHHARTRKRAMDEIHYASGRAR